MIIKMMEYSGFLTACMFLIAITAPLIIWILTSIPKKKKKKNETIELIK